MSKRKIDEMYDAIFAIEGSKVPLFNNGVQGECRREISPYPGPSDWGIRHRVEFRLGFEFVITEAELKSSKHNTVYEMKRRLAHQLHDDFYGHLHPTIWNIENAVRGRDFHEAQKWLTQLRKDLEFPKPSENEVQ